MRNVLLPFLFLFSIPSVFAAQDRDLIISRQLDCVDYNQSNQPVTWSDVCYMGTRDDHAKVVTAALDEYEAPRTQEALVPSSSTQDQMPSKLDTKKYNTFLDAPDFVKQKLDPRHTHTFDLSAETYYYRYHETIPIDVRGTMIGYNASYYYRPADDNILNNAFTNSYGIEYRFATGKLDYKGSGTINDKRNDNWELRGLIGKDFLLGDRSLVTPYFGFGFRYLFDDGKDRISSTNAVAYDRTSHYYYLPLGFTVTLPDGNWTTVLNLEYDWFLNGYQFTNLSDVNPYLGGDLYSDIKNKQENGHGFRGSLKFQYAYQRVNFFVEPFIRFWNIDDSEIKTITIGGTGPNSGSPISLLEPRNWTMELGSKFGLQF